MVSSLFAGAIIHDFLMYCLNKYIFKVDLSVLKFAIMATDHLNSILVVKQRLNL